MRNENVLIEARKAENIAGCIRQLQSHYATAFLDAKDYQTKEVVMNKVNVLRFAGSLCSMASSILCEFYNCEDSEFTIKTADRILREWGLDELIDDAPDQR